ncbi:hypothetical protein A7R75_24245 [Mycolicibacterium llatzerense]|nr:hypothetical protein [Mycolicibacterium llatzerense]
MVSGGLCVARGGLGVHKASGGSDDINISGWKSMGSWWALGGLQLAAGSYAVFQRFFNGIFHYLFGA